MELNPWEFVLILGVVSLLLKVRSIVSLHSVHAVCKNTHFFRIATSTCLAPVGEGLGEKPTHVCDERARIRACDYM